MSIELTGSEKQVSWATNIRANALVNIDRAIQYIIQYSDSKRGQWGDAAVDAQIAIYTAHADSIRTNPSAAFWIDNRAMSFNSDAPETSPMYRSVMESLFQSWTRANREALRATIA